MNSAEGNIHLDDLLTKTDELVEMARREYGIKLGTERKPVFDEKTYALYQGLRELGKNGTKEDKVRWAYEKAKLGYVNLDLAQFDGLDLSHVDFSGINLAGASFNGCNLEWANFSGTKCMLTSFQDSNLHLANMVGSLAINADFQKARITGARFRESFFNYADFSNATIEQTDMSFCIFYGARFTDAFVDQTRFEYSIYHTEPLKKAQLKSGVFSLNEEQYASLVSSGIAP